MNQKAKPEKVIVKIHDKYPPKKSPSLADYSFHELDWLEWLALIIGLWFLFYPKPYQWLLAILLILPIAGLLLNGLSKPSIASLIKIDSGENGNVDVADFIDIPALIILLRVLLDFKYESFYSLIIPGAIGMIGVLALLFFTHKRIEKSHLGRWGIYGFLIFHIFLYSYAGTYAVNCAYDFAAPQAVETTVLEKTIRSTRKQSRKYAITVAPWGEHREKERMYVHRNNFDRFEVGDTVLVNVKPGLLGIPWYYMSEKPRAK